MMIGGAMLLWVGRLVVVVVPVVEVAVLVVVRYS
jgi:hypothetical protein